MIAVIFEVVPAPGQMSAYLNTAAQLRPLLDGIDGFISIERFQSLSDPDRILSLSFWRDEAAVRQWRNFPSHRLAQAAGRESIFSDYRLRVAAVVRDYGMHNRDEVPGDSRDDDQHGSRAFGSGQFSPGHGTEAGRDSSP